MEVQTYKCNKKCCEIKIREWIPTQENVWKGNCRKAGVCIYDPITNSVLLVQSRSSLWGLPKGSLNLEQYETDIDCAIREVKEETGLDIRLEDFRRGTRIAYRAVYFLMHKPRCEVEIQHHADEEKNDVIGISWINLDCLEECIQNGVIVISYHCRIVLKRFFNRIFCKIIANSG